MMQMPQPTGLKLNNVSRAQQQDLAQYLLGLADGTATAAVGSSPGTGTLSQSRVHISPFASDSEIICLS